MAEDFCQEAFLRIWRKLDMFDPDRGSFSAWLYRAAANLVLALCVASLGPALVLRFLTGVCLAGVYPPGMKIVAGHVSGRSRGLAIGVLVGALGTR